MNIPEILPCPNPECKAECGDFYFIPEHPDDSEDGKHPVNDPVIQVQCSKCQYSGPMIKIIGHDTLTATQEAIRLHNAICRQPTPEAEEAARAIFTMVNELAILHFKKHLLDVDILPVFDSIIAKLAHPPKPEPTEAEILWWWICKTQGDFGSAVEFLDGCRPLNEQITPLEIIVRRYAPTGAAPKPPAEQISGVPPLHPQPKPGESVTVSYEPPAEWMRECAAEICEWQTRFPINQNDVIESIAKHAPKVPEGWQPIETAPKDGTVIDLWDAGSPGSPFGGHRLCDAKWDYQHWMEGKPQGEKDWLPGHRDGPAYHRITHWRHKPAVPKGEA